MARKKTAKPKGPVKAVKIRLNPPSQPAKRKTPQPSPQAEPATSTSNLNEEIPTLDLTNAEHAESAESCAEPPGKRLKKRKEPDYLYLSEMKVSVGEGLGKTRSEVQILNEASEHSAHPEKRSFDFQSEAAKEARLIERHAERVAPGKPAPLREEAQATVSGGRDSLGKTISGPEDWDQVERIVRNFVRAKKPGIRVSYLITYRYPDAEEGDQTDEGTVLSGESETDVLGPGPSQKLKCKKKRRTATEKEREREAIERRGEINYIPQLMTIWRCTTASCSQYGKGACIQRQGETCRQLNAKMLGDWDDDIKKGQATLHAWALGRKLPPTREEKLETSRERKALFQQIQSSPTPAQPTIIFGGMPPYSLPPPPAQHPLSIAPEMDCTAQRGSSPVRASADDTPEGLLDEYFRWFLEHHGGGENRRSKIAEALEAVKNTYEDLEGVRKMREEGWKELGVPVGLGKSLSREVKRFFSAR